MKNYRYLYLFLLAFLLINCKNKPSEKTKIHKNKKTLNKNKDKHTGWVVLKDLDSTFVFDMRYATTHNFVHKKMYPCPKCMVRKEVAERLVKIQHELQKKHLGLKFFDCYRPGKVQQALWEIKPDPNYVANPKNGSMHNRGVAVDVTIVDKNGKELNMGTPFDYFGKKAHQDYTDLPKKVLENRKLLRDLMQKYDMEPIRTEWWHYSYRKKVFPISQWIWDCD